MHKFTIYDAATGEVLRNGICSSGEDFALQAEEGEDILYGEQIERGHRILDGVAIQMPLPPPSILPEDVKRAARERIEARYPIWKQMNALSSGGDLEMTMFIDRVRDRSNKIEAMVPIPLDFTADHYWS